MCHNRAQSQRESVGSRREAHNNNSTRYIVQNRHTYLKLNTHTRNNEKACPKKKYNSNKTEETREKNIRKKLSRLNIEKRKSKR